MSTVCRSRFHIFKSAPTKFFLLADSQARHLEAGNFNILSLPGAHIQHAYDFIPVEGTFEIIVIFIGGNDLFNGFKPSSKPPQKVAQDLIELADFVCKRTRSSVFVLGIPERDENKTRAKEVNDILQAKAERSPKVKSPVEWKYRGVSSFVSGERYFSIDKTHLNKDGLNGIKNILKGKVLYAKYNKKLNDAGNTEVTTCHTNGCKCVCRSW